MDDLAPNARHPFPHEGRRDEGRRGAAPIWLRLFGLLAVIPPVFLGLQHLLDREETLAAEAARSALPIPTAIVVEVPVTIERVVERTVYVTVPAPSEPVPVAVAAAPPTPSAPPSEDSTTEQPAEAATAAPEEETRALEEPSGEPSGVQAGSPPPVRRAPAWAPVYYAPAEPAEEAEPAPAEAAAEPEPEEAAEAPPVREAEVVFTSEIGPSYRGVQEVAVEGPAEDGAAAAPPADGPASDAPEEDSVEALAIAAGAVIDPDAGEGGDGEADQGTPSSDPILVELGE